MAFAAAVLPSAVYQPLAEILAVLDRGRPAARSSGNTLMVPERTSPMMTRSF
jgi:hypothetical protein